MLRETSRRARTCWSTRQKSFLALLVRGSSLEKTKQRRKVSYFAIFMAYPSLPWLHLAVGKEEYEGTAGKSRADKKAKAVEEAKVCVVKRMPICEMLINMPLA